MFSSAWAIHPLIELCIRHRLAGKDAICGAEVPALRLWEQLTVGFGQTHHTPIRTAALVLGMHQSLARQGPHCPRRGFPHAFGRLGAVTVSSVVDPEPDCQPDPRM